MNDEGCYCSAGGFRVYAIRRWRKPVKDRETEREKTGERL